MYHFRFFMYKKLVLYWTKHEAKAFKNKTKQADCARTGYLTQTSAMMCPWGTDDLCISMIMRPPRRVCAPVFSEKFQKISLVLNNVCWMFLKKKCRMFPISSKSRPLIPCSLKNLRDVPINKNSKFPCSPQPLECLDNALLLRTFVLLPRSRCRLPPWWERNGLGHMVIVAHKGCARIVEWKSKCWMNIKTLNEY